MTKLLPNVSPSCIDYHPTMPLMVIGTTTGKAIVLNRQTNTAVGEVQLDPRDADKSVSPNGAHVQLAMGEASGLVGAWEVCADRSFC